MSSLPRLFVDLSVIARGDAGTGIQRVVRAVWRALGKEMAGRFELVPVAGSAAGSYRRIPADFLERPLRRLPLPWGKARLAPRQGDVFLGLDLAAHVLPRNVGQLQRWRRRGVKLAFVVYDLLPVLQPDWFSDRTREHYRRWLELICREADQLICISGTVAGELADWIAANHVRSPHIATVRLGASIAASGPSRGLPTDAAENLAWAGAGTTVMMVGTIEPRKGYDQALAAFEELWADPAPGEDFRLLIVGRPGWKTQALQERLRGHKLGGQRLRWIDNASDEYLEHLYRACWGLLLASRGEGFGLPLLEAAAHAKPVLVRDLPVFREIAPQGVAYFSAETATSLTAALREWRESGVPANAAADDLCWGKAAADLHNLLASQLGSGKC